jgi:hypothetical protein
VRNKSVVSKITGAESTAHNFIDVYYTSELAGFGADPVNEVRSGLQSFEVGVKLRAGRRRSDPNTMKFMASDHTS